MTEKSNEMNTKTNLTDISPALIKRLVKINFPWEKPNIEFLEISDYLLEPLKMLKIYFWRFPMIPEKYFQEPRRLG